MLHFNCMQIIKSHNSGKDRKFLRYFEAELNLCICFDKFNKTNEFLIPFSFDLDKLPSHKPAINSVQDMHILLIHNLIKSSISTLKQPYLSWSNRKMNLDFGDSEEFCKLTYTYKEGLKWVVHYYYDGFTHGAGFIPIFIPQLFQAALLPPPCEQVMDVLPELSSAQISPAF
ncbi:hypothetical protein VP01_7393g1 [Puccinia sorghi]|uniref:Uncharacterized protein n=1 Tax=Puccinia sorghi TaxID=27349 RepID=A0A0L6UCJ8_9BASI|nr:hypothetical protein VP01_7393g1 [Puccinia sorghi]